MKKLLKSRNVTRFVFFTFVASLFYVLAGLILAPSAAPSPEETIRVKLDYFVLLLLCYIAIGALALPEIISLKAKVRIPGVMVVIYTLFIFSGIFCGNVLNFYNTVPHWDTMLHLVAGVLVCGLGYSIFDYFNKPEGDALITSRGFATFFAFCFAAAVGGVWEMIEYALDLILDVNMQAYNTVTGVPLTGQAAVTDTMKDMILNCIGTLGLVLYRRIFVSQSKKLFDKLVLTKAED